jgi:hypothetical protein
VDGLHYSPPGASSSARLFFSRPFPDFKELSNPSLEAHLVLDFFPEPITFLVHPGFQAEKQMGILASEWINHHIPSFFKPPIFIGNVKFLTCDGAGKNPIHPELLAG